MKYSLFIFSLVLTLNSFAQDEVRKNIYKGNVFYHNNAFEDALTYYQKAIDESEFNFKANYNLANAYFRLKDYEKAIERYNKIKDYGPTNADKAQVFHNLGNAYLMNNKIDEAIEAYKSALRLVPNNEDTRYNLAYAMQMKQQQQQQQQQQQNQDQQNNQNNQDQQNENGQEGDNQDNQNGNQNQDQNSGQDQQDENGNPQDQNNQDKQDKGDGESDEQKGQQKKQDNGEGGDQSDQQNNQISKEQAKRILDAALKKEKELQNKINKGKVIKGEKGDENNTQKAKDW